MRGTCKCVFPDMQAWQCVATAEYAAKVQQEAEAVQDGVGSLDLAKAPQRSGACARLSDYIAFRADLR